MYNNRKTIFKNIKKQTNINNKMKTHNIYCVYHDESLFDQYGFNKYDFINKSNESVKHILYNTNDKLNHVYDFNYANPVFNEWVAQYNIYKNCLYSDYVSFGSYKERVTIDDIDYNVLESKGYILHCNYTLNNGLHICDIYKRLGLNYLNYLLFEYIHNSDKYSKCLPYYLTYIHKTNEYFAFREMYSCKWEIFVKLTQFIEEFAKYVFSVENDLDTMPLDMYKDKVNNMNEIEFNIRSQFITSEEHEKFGCMVSPRLFAFEIEYIIGIFFHCILEHI